LFKENCLKKKFMLIQANLGSVLYPKLALLPRLVKLPAEAAGNHWKPKLSPSCTMNAPFVNTSAKYVG
jgi:hypothetical protein